MQKNKDIKLHSRYKDVEIIFRPIDENSGITLSNTSYVRCELSEDKESLQAIDFEGGPMLSVGSDLNGKKIKSIRNVYYFELE